MKNNNRILETQAVDWGTECITVLFVQLGIKPEKSGVDQTQLSVHIMTIKKYLIWFVFKRLGGDIYVIQKIVLINSLFSRIQKSFYYSFSDRMFALKSRTQLFHRTMFLEPLVYLNPLLIILCYFQTLTKGIPIIPLTLNIP